MSAITQTLEKKLKEWPPATAQKVEQQVSELIVQADAEANGKRPQKRDPFFADTDFFKGHTPRDLAENHDKYLYGDNP